MESKRRHIDPEQMTSGERLDRIVEILVRAGLRLYWEGEGTTVLIPEPLSFEMPVPYKGRVPFGEKKVGFEREAVALEQAIIKRIVQLKAEGLSTQKIARRLNREDHESRRTGRWTRVAVWRILQRKKKGVTK